MVEPLPEYSVSTKESESSSEHAHHVANERLVSWYDACTSPAAEDADNTRAEIRDQTIGRANRENIKELLATAALYPLTVQREMPIEEFEHLISNARDEAGDAGLKVGPPQD
ncbi:hypothetical protein PWT90_01443 [Aphanocladium album]|nr:hypothetical protein PWT90_01443 [Aphanocladium album]